MPRKYFVLIPGCYAVMEGVLTGPPLNFYREKKDYQQVHICFRSASYTDIM